MVIVLRGQIWSWLWANKESKGSQIVWLIGTPNVPLHSASNTSLPDGVLASLADDALTLIIRVNSLLARKLMAAQMSLTKCFFHISFLFVILDSLFISDSSHSSFSSHL